MILSNKKPSNKIGKVSDFTLTHYEKLIELATEKFKIASYRSIPWGTRFVLWRHDVDFSLNRSLALAELERKKGLNATYFLNPHSAYYNLAEISQHSIVKKILSLGHEIGLHFDLRFYGNLSSKKLRSLVRWEAALLENLFGKKPVALSFHDPDSTTMRFEADSYAGLPNCYSKRFKTKVAYCSDSNGFWRYRRLYNVLMKANDQCLQVLTHPGWWQTTGMPPRQRIFRSVYGRAEAVMRRYDDGMERIERLNHRGTARALLLIKELQPNLFNLCDYLWNIGAFETLFIELWRLHESQVVRLCKAILCKIHYVPPHKVNNFFRQRCLSVDIFRKMLDLLGEKKPGLAGSFMDKFSDWLTIRNRLVHGDIECAELGLEKGCVFVCESIARLAAWGLAQPVAYDGLADLKSIGLSGVKAPSCRSDGQVDKVAKRTSKFKKNFWESFKASVMALD